MTLTRKQRLDIVKKRQRDEQRHKAETMAEMTAEVQAERQVLSRTRYMNGGRLDHADPDLIRAFASTLESFTVMGDEADLTVELQITATLAEVVHFVHYMRQLDDAYKNIFAAHAQCEGREKGLKAEVERLRRDAREHLATIQVLERKLRVAEGVAAALQHDLNRAQG